MYVVHSEMFQHSEEDGLLEEDAAHIEKEQINLMTLYIVITCLVIFAILELAFAWLVGSLCMSADAILSVFNIYFFTSLIKENRTMTTKRAVAEVVVGIILFSYVMYLTSYIFSIILVNGEGYRDVEGIDLYFFGAVDIVVYGALSYYYQKLLVINVFVLVTAVTLSIINVNASDSTADVDALGALFTVAILAINVLIVFVPAMWHMLRQHGLISSPPSI